MRTFLLCAAALVALAARLVGAQLRPEAATYASAADAIHDLSEGGTALTTRAATWLVRGAGLDWPIDTVYSLNPWAVAGIPSRKLNYCVLASARRGEFGPFGDARYALVDSTGRLLWSMTGRVSGWPAIADNGIVALLWAEGHAPSRWRPESLNVKFVGVDGQTIGSKAWGNRTWRPLQREALADVYGFAPMTNQFHTTVNQSNNDTLETDSDSLYAVAPDGRTLWSRGLGAMRTNELWFSASGDRIAVTDLLGASVGYQNRVVVFDSVGREIARHAIREANGADGSVLDPMNGRLYAYSFKDRVVALNLGSGSLKRGERIESIERLQRSADKKTAARAGRLVQRVAIERNRREQPH